MSPELHAARAEQLVVEALRYSIHSNARLSLLAEAQVHATLATVPARKPPRAPRAPKEATP